MRTYEYKCQRCEERHLKAVPEDKFEETYHVPCPYCGFVARRIASTAVRLEDRPEPVATRSRA